MEGDCGPSHCDLGFLIAALVGPQGTAVSNHTAFEDPGPERGSPHNSDATTSQTTFSWIEWHCRSLLLGATASLFCNLPLDIFDLT